LGQDWASARFMPWGGSCSIGPFCEPIQTWRNRTVAEAVETNAIQRQISDLRERLDALRGYL